MAMYETENNQLALDQTDVLLKYWLREIKTRTKVHAAYLYANSEGLKLQQKLCLLLSGTKCSPLQRGWEDFGSALGLDPIIKSIKYNLHEQDPTSYILLAYVQKENSTVETIVDTLYKIRRFDILEQIKDQLHIFSATLHKNPNLLKLPPIIPECPFIFKNLSNETTNNKETKLVQKLLKSVPISNSIKHYYDKKILLTYASDADQIVTIITEQLRKPQDNFKLGVLVLNEQSHKINSSPEQFIYDCFAQVDYVCPVITPQYVKEVTQSAVSNDSSALENNDHKYIKYIYRLMNTYYIRNGCENNMVRCLIPDDVVHNVLRHPIMDHSLFQIWVRTSEISTLISAIIKQKI